MKSQEIKIVFWATSDFAIPPLKALIKGGYNIVAVVTNPDEPVGRKQILTPPQVKVLAEKYGIPVYQPKTLNKRKSDFLREVRLPRTDIYIVVAYGKIISAEILDIPKFGTLNLHPSLLPRWRGPSPLQYTILNGDTETGVTVIKIDEEMDHGPIITNSKFKIQNSKVTYTELHNQLAKLGAKLLIETIPKWIAGEITPEPQDESKATYSKILTKDDGRIEWKKSAEEIEHMARAFRPWPGTWTTWQDKRLRIEEADISLESSSTATPGQVWKTTTDGLFIQTGKGSIVIKILTLEGKKTTGAAAFLRGYPNFEKSTLV